MIEWILKVVSFFVICLEKAPTRIDRFTLRKKTPGLRESIEDTWCLDQCSDEYRSFQLESSSGPSRARPNNWYCSWKGHRRQCHAFLAQWSYAPKNSASNRRVYIIFYNFGHHHWIMVVVPHCIRPGAKHFANPSSRYFQYRPRFLVIIFYYSRRSRVTRVSCCLIIPQACH
jgi:hypothetical protein